MKKLLLVTVTLFAPLIVPPHASALTGEELSAACLGNVPGMKKNKKDEVYSGACNMYITGWEEALSAFLEGTRPYCPPQVSVKELSVVFFDYMATHREERTLPAAKALMLAFKDKWPCH